MCHALGYNQPLYSHRTIYRMKKLLFLAVFGCLSTNPAGAENRIDIVRHDAPELARYGEFDIGVTTLELIASDRPDVANSVNGGETLRYDRRLTVEVWYPARLGADESPGSSYTTSTRNPDVTAVLTGKAVRDAAALNSAGALPLIIVSHGYPGNRYLISHLAENLASKGYVVASIDHRDSTYGDLQPITSTLYNRPLDQLFVLDQMETMSNDPNSFLSGIVNTQLTGIVGYSMGGYGLLINMGGGYSDVLATHEVAPPNGLATVHAASNPEFGQRLDSRVKAGFAIAPWGMARGVWQTDALRSIEIPTFYLAGSLDEVAGYELGVRRIYESTTQSARYLLTFENAGHHAGAPIPVPQEILHSEDQTGADHYTDPVWDSVRMNNIMDHFATAFFDHYLRGVESSLAYLATEPDAQWKGFPEGTAIGLTLEFRDRGQ